MKNLLLIVALLSTSWAKGCWGPSFNVEFTVELVNGEVHKGYECISALPYYITMYRGGGRRNATPEAEYVKEALLKNNNYYDTIFPDSFRYYKARLTYVYSSLHSYDEEESHYVYQLISPVSIPRSSVKTLKIDSVVSGGDYRILNAIKVSDTAWAKSKPVKQVFFYIDECGFEVFVHKWDRHVRKAMRQLKTKQRKYNKEKGELPRQGELRRHEIDPEIFTIISRLNGHKTIVIQGCYQD